MPTHIERVVGNIATATPQDLASCIPAYQGRTITLVTDDGAGAAFLRSMAAVPVMSLEQCLKGHRRQSTAVADFARRAAGRLAVTVIADTIGGMSEETIAAIVADFIGAEPYVVQRSTDVAGLTVPDGWSVERAAVALIGAIIAITCEEAMVQALVADAFGMPIDGQ